MKRVGGCAPESIVFDYAARRGSARDFELLANTSVRCWFPVVLVAEGEGGLPKNTGRGLE